MKCDKKLFFATHNKGKVESANRCFEGKVEFQICDIDIKEIRSDNIEEIAIAKVMDAYEVTGMPTIAMDAGFYVDKLNNFPGTYVNHFLNTIGVEGLLKLLSGVEERGCCFRQCLAYYDGYGQPKLFYGEHRGVVSDEIRGELGIKDWSELSYVFVPSGKEKVLAEMTDDERTVWSKEKEDDSAFFHFKKWYMEYSVSNDFNTKDTYALKWKNTCEYMRENGLITDVSFKTWIEPLELVECSEECMVFNYRSPSVHDGDITKSYITMKFERIILEAYKFCTGCEYKNIKIKILR